MPALITLLLRVIPLIGKVLAWVVAISSSLMSLFVGYQHLTGWRFISSAVTWITKRLMVALGIGFITFKGVTFAANEVISYIKMNFLELPVEVLQILGLAKVDIAFNIIMAGLMIRLYGMGLNSARDSVSKMGLVK